MVSLSVVERTRIVQHLRHDLCIKTLLAHRLLVDVAGLESRSVLGLRGSVDCAAILRADVISLAHRRGTVMRFPESLQKFGQCAWLVNDQDHLVVIGLPGADFFVGWVLGLASLVPDSSAVDAG